MQYNVLSVNLVAPPGDYRGHGDQLRVVFVSEQTANVETSEVRNEE